MLWIKSFHIVFVASWFAGLFYLPRIYVNLAMVPADSHAERERLLLMARKLMRFTTLLALLAIVLFGGAVLRDFALAMMWGVLIGTYSSVFVAVGALAFFDLKRHLDEEDDPGTPAESG